MSDAFATALEHDRQASPPSRRATDRDSRNASLVLGLSLPGDTVLYLLLPLYHGQFGVSLAEAGVLLAANRLVRIVGYGRVARFYGERGDRATCMVAATVASACAVAYATMPGLWTLLVARILWGIAFAAMNLSTQALATAELAGAARRTGQSRAIIAAGPMIGLPLAAVFAEVFSPRPFFLLLAVSALCAIPFAMRLPSTGSRMAPGRPRFSRPGSLDMWSFIEGLALDGLFIVGLSYLGRDVTPEGAVLLAGPLLALRYLAEILFSPAGGYAAERFGSERMLVLLSLATAVALIGFGAGWVWVCAVPIVVLRALQLPLVAPIVARRNPGPGRVAALATRATWRDIGAGMGPLMAGFLLPVTAPLVLYGAAAIALSLAALGCRPRGDADEAEPGRHG